MVVDFSVISFPWKLLIVAGLHFLQDFNLLFVLHFDLIGVVLDFL